jgi:hypothetical protein
VYPVLSILLTCSILYGVAKLLPFLHPESSLHAALSSTLRSVLRYAFRVDTHWMFSISDTQEIIVMREGDMEQPRGRDSDQRHEVDSWPHKWAPWVRAIFDRYSGFCSMTTGTSSIDEFDRRRACSPTFCWTVSQNVGRSYRISDGGPIIQACPVFGGHFSIVVKRSDLERR